MGHGIELFSVSFVELSGYAPDAVRAVVEPGRFKRCGGGWLSKSLKLLCRLCKHCIFSKCHRFALTPTARGSDTSIVQRCLAELSVKIQSRRAPGPNQCNKFAFFGVT